MGILDDAMVKQVNRLVVPGGYAMVFTDWRQLPTLTDVFQAGGFIWRGLVPWTKRFQVARLIPDIFAISVNTLCGAVTGRCRKVSMADHGPDF